MEEKKQKHQKLQSPSAFPFLQVERENGVVVKECDLKRLLEFFFLPSSLLFLLSSFSPEAHLPILPSPFFSSSTSLLLSTPSLPLLSSLLHWEHRNTQKEVDEKKKEEEEEEVKKMLIILERRRRKKKKWRRCW